jgi:ankyrin repeat protein
LFRPAFHAIIPLLAYLQFGKSAMHWAAEWGRMELLQALLDAGADIDKRDGVSKLAMLPS